MKSTYTEHSKQFFLFTFFKYLQRKMLSTPVQRLKALKKKEDHQFKKRAQEMVTVRKGAKGS